MTTAPCPVQLRMENDHAQRSLGMLVLSLAYHLGHSCEGDQGSSRCLESSHDSSGEDPVAANGFVN
jgi:hypothetical protein